MDTTERGHVSRRTFLRAGLTTAAWVTPAVVVLRPDPARAASPLPIEEPFAPPGEQVGGRQEERLPAEAAPRGNAPAPAVEPVVAIPGAPESAPGQLAATGASSVLLAAAGAGAVAAGAEALRRARRVSEAHVNDATRQLSEPGEEPPAGDDPVVGT